MPTPSVEGYWPVRTTGPAAQRKGREEVISCRNMSEQLLHVQSIIDDMHGSGSNMPCRQSYQTKTAAICKRSRHMLTYLCYTLAYSAK
jgi:hypothetical protein